MPTLTRVRVAALAATLCALAMLAPTAQPAAAKAKSKVSVKLASTSQRAILKRGVKVKVRGPKARRGKKRARVRVAVKARSFDDARFKRIARPKRVRLSRAGRAKVRLKLSKRGKQQLRGCAARRLRASARGSSSTRELTRDTVPCKPRRIDLSAASRCDFIGAQDGSLCLLPFPDDYYTVRDPSTETGRRIDLETAAMPANGAGTHIDAAPYNGNDGFSPGQSITLKVPGLDTPQAFERTGAVSLAKLSDYDRKRAPVVVIDAASGERVPIWVEIDSNATDPGRAATLIHPAVNFDSGHRYIVAMRNLKDATGKTLKAPEGFRYYRDELPSRRKPINAQRKRFERIFKALRKAGIERSSLYLAWDFTVASSENIAGRVLHMRDEALADLGDTTMDDLQAQGSAPAFDVSSVVDYTVGEEPDMARRVQGTFTVPCFMKPSCEPGGSFDLDASGMPQRNGTYTANFNCMIPRSALSARARPSLYGHGLLGSANEATSDPQKTLGNSHNIVSCATDEIGLSSGDLTNTVGILQDLSRFPELADRLQQGLLNEIYLGRLMLLADGFASDPAFRADDEAEPGPSNPSVIDPERLYYNGNSQGAIEGGALVAISPDVTRGSLGVGGMNYSVLLNRSVDFDTYALFLNTAYTDQLERPLVLSLIQMLWDRGESNGYANTLGDNPPLPDTPPSEVLMNVGFGDHQVSNFTADTMARTIGAEVHAPVLYDGRWPGVEQVWGVPRISSYPHTGSALVYWDGGPIRPDPDNPGEELGTNPPHIENIPNREGRDPHEDPRRTVAEQQMVSDFLQLDAASHITDTCEGSPCFDRTFKGP